MLVVGTQLDTDWSDLRFVLNFEKNTHARGSFILMKVEKDGIEQVRYDLLRPYQADRECNLCISYHEGLDS